MAYSRCMIDKHGPDHDGKAITEVFPFQHQNQFFYLKDVSFQLCFDKNDLNILFPPLL